MQKVNKFKTYKNGNAIITIKSDGTRIVRYPENEELKLEYPLNIDIRLSNRCPLGYNPETKQESKTCSFCHESATTNGAIADFNKLKNVLDVIPSGMSIELAIGLNEIRPDKTDAKGIFDFFEWAHYEKGFIINTTINQLSIASSQSDTSKLMEYIDKGIISGVGISFRSLDKFKNKTLQKLIEYPHTVVHVINGIDKFDDVLKLHEYNVKKLLILGEKNFGFNVNMFNDLNHVIGRKYWFENLAQLFPLYKVISFDNLGLEQLDIKRFVKDEQLWDLLYQGEHSFYINAVDEYFSPSSRSSYKQSFNETNLYDFFYHCENTLSSDIKDM